MIQKISWFLSFVSFLWHLWHPSWRPSIQWTKFSWKLLMCTGACCLLGRVFTDSAGKITIFISSSALVPLRLWSLKIHLKDCCSWNCAKEILAWTMQNRMFLRLSILTKSRFLIGKVTKLTSDIIFIKTEKSAKWRHVKYDNLQYNTLGTWVNHWPCVWCSEYYFFFIISCKILRKNVSFFFKNLQK